MRNFALVLATLILAGCDVPVRLEPDLAKSYAMPAGSFEVGILGEGWAVRAAFKLDEVPYHTTTGPLVMTLRPRKAVFIEGHDLDPYIRPGAGPPTPPVPETPSYRTEPIDDLTVTIFAPDRKREPDGFVFVTLSGFTVGDRRYAPLGPIRLPLRGPYP